MNARVTFDTHAFVRKLESAGMSLGQAEALADALGDIVLPELTTKSDLRELDVGFKAELKELDLSLRAELKELDLNLRAEIKELELRITGRLGGMIAGSTALTVAILGALITLS